MKVVVTGKAGQLALSLRRKGALHDFEMVFASRPEFDLGNSDSIVEFLCAVRPDVVVNAAAYTAVDLAEDNLEQAQAANVDGPATIARWCATAGARMIHLSTDYVYSGEGSAAYVENDPVAPVNVYGTTKLAGERAVQAGLAQHLIMRTAWVYSPFGRNFVKTMLQLARNRKTLNVVADQHGNPTSALDLADAICLVLASWQTGGNTELGQIYHVAGSGTTSWADLAEHTFACSKEFGGPWAEVCRIAAMQYPTRALRPQNSRLNCSKFAQHFGHKLPQWQQSVRETVSEILKNEINSTI